MKILLLGKNGFLGSEIFKVLEKNGTDFLAPDRKKVDIITPQLEAVCKSYRPDFIINCTAYTDVDNAEVECELAYEINSEAVARMGNVAKEINSKLIHFSTDYVFDGGDESGYREDDATGPLNVYGKSKLSGERNLLDSGADAMIIRTSFPFGDHPKCFLQKILKKGENYNKLKVIDSFVSSPTYFYELAERVYKYLNDFPGKGIYHLTNFGSCSRAEFAKTVFKILKNDVTVEALDYLEKETIALRPKSSVLINTKLEQMEPWTDALEKYLNKNL